MRRVSRNYRVKFGVPATNVTPRMRRVSRNIQILKPKEQDAVTPRMRRVSRNSHIAVPVYTVGGHASHEACE